MIYTAITGGKDKPRDDIHVFSEYSKFKNNRLNAKIYKVLPHLFMDTEWSIWVDGNLHLYVEPEELLAQMGHKDIAVFTHPERTCLYQEAEVCKAQELDDPEIIDEQVARYRADGFPENAGLGACYLIVRKHTPEIARLNEKWWAEITRGSQRDQISFPYVFNGAVQYLNRVGHQYTRVGHQIKTTKDQ